MAKKFDDKPVVYQRQVSLDDRGAEVMDSQRMFVKARSNLSMMDRMRQVVRNELSLRAHDEGFETFEESNDFDVDDPWDSYHTELTAYEVHAMVDELPAGLGAPVPEEPVGDEPPASPDPAPTPPEHPDPE